MIAWCAIRRHRWLIAGLLSLLTVLSGAFAVQAAATKPAPLKPLVMESKARIDLGRQLFFDRRLSGDGTMSCVVCHIPDQAFSDGRPLSGAYPTNKHWRNTPSLINAAYLDVLFWDGRVGSLQEQVLGPIESPFEMNADLDYVVAKLMEIPGYRKAFLDAYGAEISPALVQAALAAFEQTLVMTDSPFDRYLSGQKEALGTLERQGMELFYGERGGCAECHAGPTLSDQKYYNLGVSPAPEFKADQQHRTTLRYALISAGLPMMEDDPGRYLVSRLPEDKGAFRTPPLRQVSQTGPYMHNGSLKTLTDVVEFFSRGGGDSPDKTDRIKPRDFTAEEQTALVAFLKSLSGTVPDVRRPVLPGD